MSALELSSISNVDKPANDHNLDDEQVLSNSAAKNEFQNDHSDRLDEENSIDGDSIFSNQQITSNVERAYKSLLANGLQNGPDGNDSTVFEDSNSFSQCHLSDQETRGSELSIPFTDADSNSQSQQLIKHSDEVVDVDATLQSIGNFDNEDLKDPNESSNNFENNSQDGSNAKNLYTMSNDSDFADTVLNDSNNSGLPPNDADDLLATSTSLLNNFDNGTPVQNETTDVLNNSTNGEQNFESLLNDSDNSGPIQHGDLSHDDNAVEPNDLSVPSTSDNSIEDVVDAPQRNDSPIPLSPSPRDNDYTESSESHDSQTPVASFQNDNSVDSTSLMNRDQSSDEVKPSISDDRDGAIYQNDNSADSTSLMNRDQSSDEVKPSISDIRDQAIFQNDNSADSTSLLNRDQSSDEAKPSISDDRDEAIFQNDNSADSTSLMNRDQSSDEAKPSISDDRDEENHMKKDENADDGHISESSSPGRLRIDAEDNQDEVRSPNSLRIDSQIPDETSVSVPVSEDEADPDALTIDTTGMDVDPQPERDLTLVDEEQKTPMLNSNIEATIDTVAKGLASPIRISSTSIPKRRTPLKKVKKNRMGRLGPSMGKIVKRRQISSLLRCPRCPMSSFNTVTALLEHQRVCGSTNLNVPSATSTTDAPKAPRKVYMCSACETHFENWNLFSHMKEMHKRHICLHCLGMFSQAGKLAQHLALKHHIIEQSFVSVDEFASSFPGPHFLLCCRCDRMCNENDFESHSCSTVCSHCGLSGTHYPTCRLAPPPPIRPVKTQKRRSRGPRRSRAPVSVAPPALPPTQDPALTPPPQPSPADDLSPNTFNERMLQLYKTNNRLPEKTVSSLQSIEESINRVVESATDGDIEKEDEMEVSSSPLVSPSSEKQHLDFEPEESLPKEQEVEEPPAEDAAPVADDDFQEEEMPEEEPPMNRSDAESSDSEKLMIELEPKRRRQEMEEPTEASIAMAGEETPFTHVPLPEPLDVPRVPTAMKLFVRSTALNCVYCAHARKIAVNGKQLALHLLAQHRYVTVSESTSLPERAQSHATVVRCIREALPTLETMYFNAYGFDSADKTAWRSGDRVYECFHCCYSTPDSKEFFSHNRKIHQNSSPLCIMCKARFFTYSELLCHLCKGVYVPGRIIDPHLRYRCYACDTDPLPSSFQLMVHLRHVHTACDMCFAVCDSQLALSAHVPKHKCLFYCYACGLTYRTRQDVSKHIFWKHGAESVTCKRCLQKKWRHAYHFCLPPPGFACEECGSWFKTASTLRVHKRLHQGVFPHSCMQCTERFISAKLLAKHVVAKHEPAPVNGSSSSPTPELQREKKQKKKKEVPDVFDLPPVNLSESDDSSGDEKPPTLPKEEVKPKEEQPVAPIAEDDMPTEPPAESAVSMGAVWDGVLASLEKNGRNYPPDSPFYNLPLHKVTAIMLGDHGYCRPVSTAANDSQAALDHDYCNSSSIAGAEKRSPRKSSKRKPRSSSSDSSSSSGSSCSCGSNCSCSSSSSSTESATSGEPRPPRKKLSKAEIKANNRKEKEEVKREAEIDTETNVDVGEDRILESDLETDEAITDDDNFYEKNPTLRASEVYRQSRSLLLDRLESTPRPSQTSPRRKLKKKRSPQSLGAGRSPKTPRSLESSSYVYDETATEDSDGKRPRRKRVPLKFYGFSSGEEDEVMPMPKKKDRVPEHNTTTPAPPEPEPSPPSPEPSNLWNPPAWRPPPVVPKVNPIKIRTGSLKQTFAKSVDSGEFTITRAEFGGFHVNGAASAARGEKLYCFCQCPYDEVSEMIACDATDCRIEWFHFECVGIMVPPKGKWFCPDCKKKAAAESELLGLPLRPG